MRAPLATLAAFAICLAPAARAQAPEHLTPRSAYLARCGGCHGIDGRAFAATVPDLKGKAGYFLCDPAGRDYIARLPNIVFSRLTDAELADLLNYVAFDLGGESAPKGARPYSAAEAARARREPLRDAQPVRWLHAPVESVHLGPGGSAAFLARDLERASDRAHGVLVEIFAHLASKRLSYKVVHERIMVYENAPIPQRPHR